MVGDGDCPLSKVICRMGDVPLCLLSLAGADLGQHMLSLMNVSIVHSLVGSLNGKLHI